MTSPVEPSREPTARQVLAAALASLPRCTPPRLRALLRADPDLASVLSALAAGRTRDLPGLGRVPDDVVGAWRSGAGSLDIDRVRVAIVREGALVHVVDDPTFPPTLAADPNPPGVLFERTGGASLAHALSRPRVAIVGTRRCTHYGRDVAAHLGRELAAAGVAVISGLALGIDGAAHEGALSAEGAPPIAVVGSGLDVVYPTRHRRLWGRVAAAGSVVTEAPMGGHPTQSRFPLRNRIIAALSDVVIVVESHAAGGSMHTVQAAIDRGVPVMAVPGSVRSPSSVGTNRLLADGVAPVLDVDDVLVALSLSARPTLDSTSLHSQPRPEVDGVDADVLEAVDWEPTSTERVLQRTGLAVGPAATALARLEMAGLVRSSGGSWERC